MRYVIALLFSLALFPAPALAETPPLQQGAVAPVVPEDHVHMPPSDTSQPSSRAFTDINAKMHQEMSLNFSGNADVDFVRGMIPHHEGAISMAKVVQQYGTDPELKKLADNIITSQTAEVVMMKAWLAKHGK